MGIYFNGEGNEIGNRPKSKKWSIYKIVGSEVVDRRRRWKKRYIKVFGVCTNNEESHHNPNNKT